jgi:diguanylate cyclase (GGDEF)-like protein
VGRHDVARRARPFLFTAVVVAAVALAPYRAATPQLTLYGLLAAAMLVPVLWSSLYGRPTETALMTAVAAASAAVVAHYVGHIRLQDLGQPLIVWTIVAGLAAYAIHSLRLNLATLIASREEMIRRTAVMDLAATELYASLDPDEVLRIGLRAAAHLVVPDEESSKEAYFFLVEHDSATLMAHYDQNTHRKSRELTFAAADAPLLLATAEQRGPTVFQPQPVADALSDRLPDRLGFLHGVAVPLRMTELTDGEGAAVVIVGSEDNRRFTRAQAERLGSFATVLHLALSRALQHAADATTDQVTRLANRREFNRRLHTMPRGDEYCLLSMEVDGYEYLHDTAGRETSDEFVRQVATAMQRVVRAADILARTGGGEFSAILPHADAAQARGVAERLIAAAEAVRVSDRRARLSVGAAFVVGGKDPASRLTAADAALYRAKISGGGKVVVDEPAAVLAQASPAPAGAASTAG